MREEDYQTIRKEIRFTGAVQGVGFRYRAKYAASGCGVTGWVKNEWDGSVEMEVQGDPAAIAALLERLNRMSYAWIDRMSCVDMEIIEENGFYVR